MKVFFLSTIFLGCLSAQPILTDLILQQGETLLSHTLNVIKNLRNNKSCEIDIDTSSEDVTIFNFYKKDTKDRVTLEINHAKEVIKLHSPALSSGLLIEVKSCENTNALNFDKKSYESLKYIANAILQE